MNIDNIKKEILNKFNYNNIILNKNFYTFEGIDGSGKTTIINKVFSILKKKYKVFLSSEPSCSRYGFCEEITKLIYKTCEENNDKISSKTIAFLFAALRNEHVSKVILPKINEGYVVLCDRYIDSSLVYQGLLGDNIENVCTLNKICTNNLFPKKTFLLYLNPKEAIKRIKKRNAAESNFLDFYNIDYYKKIDSYYDLLSNIFNNRIVKVNNDTDPDLIADKIANMIVRNLNE